MTQYTVILGAYALDGVDMSGPDGSYNSYRAYQCVCRYLRGRDFTFLTEDIRFRVLGAVPEITIREIDEALKRASKLYHSKRKV